jgi:hypothetical protein
MASLTRVHPTTAPINVETIGQPLQIFTIDYINAVNAGNGPEGVQALVQNAIMATATIVINGPLGNSNTEQTFVTEGSDSIVVGTLQTAIRALGTTAGDTSVDVSTATVTAKTFTVSV